MIYMGSKRLLAKHLKPIIESYIDSETTYVEPFVGGGNLITEIDANKKIGFDVCEKAISALTLIRDAPHKLPKSNLEFTEEDYKNIRKDKYHELHGYCAYALSWGGKQWGGWARNKQGQDYVACAYRNALKQSKNLQDVDLICSDYKDIRALPLNSVIYCDPPYAGKTGYKSKFDHDKFWRWCRHLSKHRVILISEYTAPDDFKTIWEKEHICSLHQQNTKKPIEKLFKWEG